MRFNACKRALIVFVLLVVPLAWAQNGESGPYILRAMTATYDATFGTAYTCFVVYPNGKYRLERGWITLNDLALGPKVYLSSFPTAKLKSLKLLLNNKGFQEMKTPLHPGWLFNESLRRSMVDVDVNDRRSLRIVVPRKDGTQNLDFEFAAERKPFKKTIKQLEKFLEAVERRKVPLAISEKPNYCEDSAAQW